MGAGAELRNCYSEFDVFYNAEVGFCAKSCFNDIICPQYRISICVIYGSAPFVIKYPFTLNLQTFLKHRLTLVTSILYIFDKSSTLVIQFENPCSCKRNSWLYTYFTNWEFGIWYNRLKKFSNDIWHDALGGNCPHSPITMKFDVVALTLNMERIYRKNTRSK